MTFVGISWTAILSDVIIDFFVRAYIRRHGCDVQFFESKDVALAQLQAQIQLNPSTSWSFRTDRNRYLATLSIKHQARAGNSM